MTELTEGAEPIAASALADAEQPADIPIPDEMVITLRKPVSLGGETWSTLSLREPTGAEWLLWDNLTGVEANIKAISTVSAVPEPVVRQIGVRDLQQATAFLNHFF